MAHYGPHDHWQQARWWKPSHSYGSGLSQKTFKGGKKKQMGRCAFAEISTLISHLCVSSPLWSFYQFQHSRGAPRMPDWRIVCQVSHVFQVSARNPVTPPPSATQHNLHHIQHAPWPGSLPCRQTGSDWGDRRRLQLMSYWYQWQSNLQCLHRAGGNELI